LWLLKLDSIGNISWQKTYGGSSIDCLYPGASIQQTLDGGYIVAGFYSFGADGSDFWVLKLDGSGDVTWQKTYEGADSDYASSIQQTLDSGYIVAGLTESFGAGHFDNWVIKLDSDGNITWQKTYGGSEGEFYAYIKQTTDEGYIMTSTTESFGAGYFDFWIITLDNSGNVSWEKTYGGSDSDSPWSIQQTLNGGYIVSGWTDSFGAGGRDLWVLKLNSNGEIPGCNFMTTSNATVTDTSVSGVNTSITAQAYSSTVTDTSITPQDTSAMIDTICPADVRIDIGDGSGFKGSINSPVEMSLNNPDDKVSGLQVDICDVDDYLTCNDCETTGRTSGFDCVVMEQGNGCCRLILFCKNPGCFIEEGMGSIVTVKYGVSAGAPVGECRDLSPEDALVSDYDGWELDVISFPGEFCFFDCTSDQDCDDDNVCTDEACVDGACQHANNTNPCPDDLFCNGEEYCGSGWCGVGPGDIPCLDDELFCNGMEGCDEENDVCTHSGNPCVPPYVCDEVNDQCVLADTIITPGDIFCTPGQTNACKKPICLDNPEALVGGIQFDLCEYDMADDPIDCMACVDCELTERTTMFDCAVLELPNGCCRVILFCKNPGCAINPGLCDIVTIVYEMFDLSEDCPGTTCLTQITENIIASDYEGYALTPDIAVF